MNAQLFGPIAVALNDGPVTTEYGRGIEGKPFASLVIGDGTQSIAVSVTDATPDILATLAEKVAELAAWQQRHTLTEVA